MTAYSYDKLDNLTLVNQDGQARSFTYDVLSRVPTEKTTEDGTTTYTCTNFREVKLMD